MFRAEMWSGACEDALYECGIAERRFGPLQANIIEDLPDAPALNTVLGAGEAGAVGDGHLAAAVEWADAFAVDFQVLVGHQRPETAAAEAWLNRHGFEQGHSLVRYARNARSLPDLAGNRGIKIWELGDRGEESVGGETMIFDAGPALGLPASASSMLFELPGRKHWRCYTAELDGEGVVGYGSMLLRDGIAALGLDGTVECARGRGCNLALVRQRLLAAYEAGCETVFAGIPVYGEEIPVRARNLVRAGFVPAHRSVYWQRPRLS
jgi:hypothetical protein